MAQSRRKDTIQLPVNQPAGRPLSKNADIVGQAHRYNLLQTTGRTRRTRLLWIVYKPLRSSTGVGYVRFVR